MVILIGHIYIAQGINGNADGAGEHVAADAMDIPPQLDEFP